ncbi:MAG: DUF4012 domain-containing protein [Patescibacteria group bacterium]|nr:DUF4012 domain-containing protein [Patescibacteria group bacterium]
MFKKKKSIILVIIFIVFFYSLFFVFLPIKSVYSQTKLIKNNLAKIEDYIKQDDFDSVEILINQTNANISIIQKNLKTLSIFKLIPTVNEKFNAINGVVNNAKIITNSVNQVLSETNADISKNDILIHFLKNKDTLKDLKIGFENLAKNLDVLNGVVNLKNSKLSESIEFISNALKFLEPFNEHIYDMFGKNGEKKYLLLFQNNTELRPTGGFIGTYGILTIQDTKIKNLFIDDIYHLDSASIGKLKNKVPEAITKYLETPEWYMRDCNFEPDFPSSMNDCINLYKLESQDNTKIDGVIAITPSVVGEILGVIGIQTIEGVIFEKENFTDDLQKAVELYYKERAITSWDRKDIIKSLANSMLSELKNRSLSDYSKILNIIDSHLKTKDIILYSTNPKIQNILVKNNWAGEIKNINSDYLMIVDSNLASYKSDQFLERIIKYSIEKIENDYIATVEITYKHNGTFSWNSTRYRTYTRILVPRGSWLLETKGSMDTDRSDKPGTTDIKDLYNKTIFGTFISTEPKTSNTLTFKYRLAENIKDQINNKSYKLFIQKQAGVKNVNYKLNILNFKSNFDLNNDKEIVIK